MYYGGCGNGELLSRAIEDHWSAVLSHLKRIFCKESLKGKLCYPGCERLSTNRQSAYHDPQKILHATVGGNRDLMQRKQNNQIERK